MRNTVILIVVILLSSLVPALAVDTALQGVTATIMTNPVPASSADIQRFNLVEVFVPFRFEKTEMIFVQIDPDGASYNGVSASDWSDRIREAVLTELGMHMDQCNFVLVDEGQSTDGALILIGANKAMSGKEAQTIIDSVDDGYSINRKGKSFSTQASAFNADRWEDTKIQMALTGKMVRLSGSNKLRYVSIPGVIAKSDSTQTYADSSNSSSNSDSFSKPGRSSSSNHTEYHSSTMRKDEAYEQEVMADPIATYIAHKLVCRWSKQVKAKLTMIEVASNQQVLSAGMQPTD